MSADTAAVPLSLSYYTVPELSPPEMIEVAAECGCRHVGMRLLGGQPTDPPAPLLADQSVRRETKRRLAATGVTVLDANSARLVPTTNIADFRPFLAAAAELGARHIMASGNDPDEGRLVDRLATLAELAAEGGMTVDIEFVPWMSVRDVTTAARVVVATKRANLGIAVDALHFQRSGSTLAEIAALPRAWLRFMQICDAPGTWDPEPAALLRTAVAERLLPGEGAIDLVGLLRAMPHGIPLALEIPTATLAQRLDARARVARAVAATRSVLAAAFPG